jgi:hypothetical protein
MKRKRTHPQPAGAGNPPSGGETNGSAADLSPPPGEAGARPGLWRQLQAPGTLVAFAAVLLLFANTWTEAQQRIPGQDFYGNWLMAHIIRDLRLTNPCDPDQRVKIAEWYKARVTAVKDNPNSPPRERVVAPICNLADPKLEITGTPFYYMTLAALAGLNYEAAFQIHLLVGLLGFLLGIVVLGRLTGSGAVVWFAAAALVCLTEGFQSQLRVMNFNWGQVGALALAIYLLSKGRGWGFSLAGAGLGLLILFKPNTLIAVAPLFMLWLITRQWRKLAWAASGMAAAGLAGFLASAAFLSVQAWLTNFQVLATILQSPPSLKEGNFSLPVAIEDFWDIKASGILLGASLAAFAVIVLVVNYRKKRPPRPVGGGTPKTVQADFLAMALGVAIGLASSRFCWSHYYVLLSPLIVYLMAPTFAAGLSAPLRIARGALLVLAMLCLASPGLWASLGFSVDNACRMPVIGLALLCLLGFWELWRVGPITPVGGLSQA